MIDLTDFKKYKKIYFLIIFILTLLFVLRITPSSHEVFVDVVIKPPENTGKSELNWMTVNEWFMAQANMIKSDAILGGIKSDISQEELKGIISARRLGASNIIRISVFSDGNLEKLKSLVSDIANSYLSQLKKREAQQPEQEKIAQLPEREETAEQLERIKMLDCLGKDRLKKEAEMKAAGKRLENYENEASRLGQEASQLAGVRGRIEEIERQLIPLNRELVRLRTVYTDNWPSVSSLLSQIKMLESERKKLEPQLSALQKLEDKKAVLNTKINKEEKGAESLRNELKEIDSRLARIEQMVWAEEEKREARQLAASVPQKKEPVASSSSLPEENRQRLYLRFGITAVIAAGSAFIFWFLLGLFLKNLYLYWVFKERILRRR